VGPGGVGVTPPSLPLFRFHRTLPAPPVPSAPTPSELGVLA